MIGKLPDKPEAADAAPRPTGEPRGEIKQQWWRLGAGRERPADAVEVDAIGRVGQRSHLFDQLLVAELELPARGERIAWFLVEPALRAVQIAKFASRAILALI